MGSENKKQLRNTVRMEAHKLLHSVLIRNGIPENKHKFVYNKYGKPYLEDDHGLYFNISHCSELAICAAAEHPVGADAEKIRDFPERVVKRCFTLKETEYIKKSKSPQKAFFQLWTLKESYVKAIGKGLIYPLKKAEFIIDNDNITANTETELSFVQIIIDNEFICSVCCDNILNNKVYYRSYENEFSLEPMTSQL